MFAKTLAGGPRFSGGFDGLRFLLGLLPGNGSRQILAIGARGREIRNEPRRFLKETTSSIVCLGHFISRSLRTI